MALFAISDLHLPAREKPMDVFGAHWENHFERIREDWLQRVGEEDVVLLPGDLTWAMRLEDALEDIARVGELPGRKIILRGNHDYWWQTVTKMKKFLAQNNITTIDFIYNNCFIYNNVAICGTRGWMIGQDKNLDQQKILLREAGRLERSLKSAPEDIEKIAVLHYPVILKDCQSNLLVDVLKKYQVKRCFYGHLHGKSINYAFCGEKFGINFKLVSADSIDFCVLNILQ